MGLMSGISRAIHAAIDHTGIPGVSGGGASLWITPVRLATTAAGTLASSFENGDSIDGFSLVTGDRILIKDQATASQNGIYVVNASGAPTRATDADSGAEFPGMVVYVKEGTTNGDSIWGCTNDTNPTLGTTAINFKSQGLGPNFSGAGSGAGVIDFTSTTVDVYSPDSWATGSDDSTFLTVGDTGAALENNASTPHRLIGFTDTHVNIIAEHTPGSGEQSGLQITLGSDDVQLLMCEKDSSTVQLFSIFEKVELYDNSDVWQHHDGFTGVIKTLTSMESRKSDGTATIASGTTSITVTHGAGYTPSTKDIVVTPTNDPTNVPGHWWIANVGATTFDIKCHSDPGAGGMTFAWRVDR